MYFPASKEKDDEGVDKNQYTTIQSIPDDRSTLGRITVNISQSIPSDRVLKGPSVTVRSAALNDHIGIRRRSGEGSTPIFERKDVIANATDCITEHGGFVKESVIQKDVGSSKSVSKYDVKKTSVPTSTQTKKPYVHRGCCGKPPIRKYAKKTATATATSTTSSRSKSPKKEKLAYYRDEIREMDRLERLYGDPKRYKFRLESSSGTTSHRRITRGRSVSRDRHRKDSPHKSARSNSNDERGRVRKTQRDHAPPKSRRRSSSKSGHRSQKSRRSRSCSPQRHRSRTSRHRSSSSPCCSHKRSRSNEHTSRRSRSPTKRSAQTSTEQQPMVTPTFIPVPVPVPADYAYSYPPWTAVQPPWTMHRPPADPYGFPMQPPNPYMRPMHPIRYPGPPAFMPYYAMPIPYYPHRMQRFPQPRPNLAILPSIKNNPRQGNK